MGKIPLYLSMLGLAPPAFILYKVTVTFENTIGIKHATATTNINQCFLCTVFMNHLTRSNKKAGRE